MSDAGIACTYGAAFDMKKALKRAAALRGDPWDGIGTLRQLLPEDV
ncbi:hypothetical protein KK133_14070 [Rhodanobacter sp. LX-100]|nr:hypothetical protein [Rhodanobacter sp. LX-100]MBT2149584.1 hypothetical protein [Rhodanobacter sp. LX-100]